MSKGDNDASRVAAEQGALPPKAQRRADAKRAAARRAAVARRKRMLEYLLIVVVIVGIGFGIAWLGGVFGADNKPGSDTASSAGATQSPSAPASFPPVPADADPALKTKPVVAAGTGTLSELKVTTLIEGKGAPIEAGQSVTVNYVGVSYTTGKEFDSSWGRQQPFTTTIPGNVIAGWNQGLAGVKVGSRVQLDIPSKLAYGDTAGTGQPSGPLRFVVDVLAAS